MSSVVDLVGERLQGLSGTVRVSGTNASAGTTRQRAIVTNDTIVLVDEQPGAPRRRGRSRGASSGAPSTNTLVKGAMALLQKIQTRMRGDPATFDGDQYVPELDKYIAELEANGTSTAREMADHCRYIRIALSSDHSDAPRPSLPLGSHGPGPVKLLAGGQVVDESIDPAKTQVAYDKEDAQKTVQSLLAAFGAGVSAAGQSGGGASGSKSQTSFWAVTPWMSWEKYLAPKAEVMKFNTLKVLDQAPRVDSSGNVVLFPWSVSDHRKALAVNFQPPELDMKYWTPVTEPKASQYLGSAYAQRKSLASKLKPFVTRLTNPAPQQLVLYGVSGSGMTTVAGSILSRAIERKEGYDTEGRRPVVADAGSSRLYRLSCQSLVAAVEADTGVDSSATSLILTENLRLTYEYVSGVNQLLLTKNRQRGAQACVCLVLDDADVLPKEAQEKLTRMMKQYERVHTILTASRPLDRRLWAAVSTRVFVDVPDTTTVYYALLISVYRLFQESMANYRGGRREFDLRSEQEGKLKEICNYFAIRSRWDDGPDLVARKQSTGSEDDIKWVDRDQIEDAKLSIPGQRAVHITKALKTLDQVHLKPGTPPENIVKTVIVGLARKLADKVGIKYKPKDVTELALEAGNTDLFRRIKQVIDSHASIAPPLNVTKLQLDDRPADANGTTWLVSDNKKYNSNAQDRRRGDDTVWYLAQPSTTAFGYTMTDITSIASYIFNTLYSYRLKMYDSKLKCVPAPDEKCNDTEWIKGVYRDDDDEEEVKVSPSVSCDPCTGKDQPRLLSWDILDRVGLYAFAGYGRGGGAENTNSIMRTSTVDNDRYAELLVYHLLN